MTLNPDYLTSISHSKKSGSDSYPNLRNAVYSNKSRDGVDSGTASGTESGRNSGNNSISIFASGAYRDDDYREGVDSLGSSLNNNGDAFQRGGGRHPSSQTAPARLGMWEDERGEDKFLKVNWRPSVNYRLQGG